MTLRVDALGIFPQLQLPELPRGGDPDAAIVGPAGLCEINANFRSVKPILDFVNARFAAPLSSGQRGFAELSHTIVGTEEPAVVALDVTVSARFWLPRRSD